jgi:hypothetical protein
VLPTAERPPSFPDGWPAGPDRRAPRPDRADGGRPLCLWRSA